MLPGTVCVLIPALLLPDGEIGPWALALVGAVLLAVGVAVIAVLLGEAALFASPAVLGWALAVFAINAVYFPLVEEPDLRRRFGAAYDEYAARTPRWLPR
jgi:protein-S-isoprenylcysteine O-methyltransferase Ste14